MNINIISVGKVKEKYIRDGIKEFEKRLSRYAKVNIIELQDEATPDNASEKQELMIKEKEGERILSKIPERGYVIALAIEGKQLSSEDLAEKMEDIMIDGINNISFIIGGSLGLDEKVLKRADLKLSFSKMTFPHQLMRLILVEQIYRAFRIMKGEPYHK